MIFTGYKSFFTATPNGSTDIHSYRRVSRRAGTVRMFWIGTKLSAGGLRVPAREDNIARQLSAMMAHGMVKRFKKHEGYKKAHTHHCLAYRARMPCG